MTSLNAAMDVEDIYQIYLLLHRAKVSTQSTTEGYKRYIHIDRETPLDLSIVSTRIHEIAMNIRLQLGRVPQRDHGMRLEAVHNVISRLEDLNTQLDVYFSDTGILFARPCRVLPPAQSPTPMTLAELFSKLVTTIGEIFARIFSCET